MFNIVHGTGVEETPLELLQDAVNVAKGDVVYNASGYSNNTFGNVTTALIQGVAQSSVDNSGGSAGDTKILVETSPLVNYKIDTADAMTQAQTANTCALASANTITSAANGTDITGIAKLFKKISASKALGRLIFSGVADA